MLALRLGSNAKAVFLSNTSATSPINEDTGLEGGASFRLWRARDLAANRLRHSFLDSRSSRIS